MKKLLIILSFACCIMAVQAQNVNLKKSVEDGIKTSIQQTENREWKEAFATCRALDGLIAVEEQKTKQAAPELHYLVSKERLRMYMRLNNAEQSKLQIAKLEDFASKAKKDEVSEDDYFESVFSFYDSAKFLRYDETADELAVGNSYDEYKSSDYSSGVAYLYFEDAKHAEMYVDYAYTDVTVSTDPEEVVEDTTEEEEETTGDETNPWMLASSIALVAVLLFAIVSIIFRKVFKKFFKKFFKKNKEDKKTKKAKKEKAKKEKKARKQQLSLSNSIYQVLKFCSYNS